MSYKIYFAEEALKDIARLRKSGDKMALRRLDKLLNELREHPDQGTGSPEQLKHDFAGLWSRRISGKHRLIYEIKEELGHVNVIQTYGHYSDK